LHAGRASAAGTPGEPVAGEWDRVVDTAAKVNNVLCLTDNAGEVAVKRLATKVLGDGSIDFRQCLDRVYLIIAKGQGKLESLSGTGNNIAFWFQARREVVSHPIGLPVGAHALLSSSQEVAGR
jgi:uncharacterized protein with ATP-grasp and redox domains